MKKITCLLLLLLSLNCYAQDRFNDALVQLKEDLGYASETVRGEKLYTTQESVDQWLLDQVKKCSEHEELLEEINFNKIQSLNTTYVKSESPIEENLYLRIQIQEWQFKNDDEASQFNSQLDKCALRAIECINKGGMTWWRVEDKVYVIFSRAYRFSFEFDKIKASLIKKLK